MNTIFYRVFLLGLVLSSCSVQRQEEQHVHQTQHVEAVRRMEQSHTQETVRVRLSDIEARWQRFHPGGAVAEQMDMHMVERSDEQTIIRDTIVLTDTLYLSSEQVVQQTERSEHRSGAGALPFALLGGLLLGITIGYQLWLRRR